MRTPRVYSGPHVINTAAATSRTAWHAKRTSWATGPAFMGIRVPAPARWLRVARSTIRTQPRRRA